MSKPPLDLSVEITDASGVRYRWDPGDKIAGNRPQGLSFNTKRGDGFAEASVTLARRIDQDYVDLNLFDDVAFIGAEGSIAYEGRVAAQPRSFSSTHSISVACAGWMTHARDRTFSEIYIDRDLSAWQAPSRTRQAALLAANYGIHNFEASRDSTNGFPALLLRVQGNWVSPYLPIVAPLYDAGPGNRVASVYISTTASATVDASFTLKIVGGDTDSSFPNATADLWAGSPTASYNPIGPNRYVAIEFYYTTTPAGSAGAEFTMEARNLAVYGEHGLPFYGEDPKGYYASDVISNIAGRFCPRLNTRGVQATGWPIPHLVFKDQTDPYDAFLAVNAYHLWELAVWEDKTLTFGPIDRTDYDWEVRLSDNGVDVDLQGDSTEDLANGIIVEFTDVATGARDVLTPDVSADLVDLSNANPANQHGLTVWTKIALSIPTTAEAALQIGRTALAEFNAPKAPGTIRVKGHIRDRAGHWQQAWKVRAGDMISITDHPNDAPRLVTETGWNHEAKELTVTVDSTAKRLDAVLDRIGVALTAAGLS